MGETPDYSPKPLTVHECGAGTIAGYPALLSHVSLDGATVALYSVPDLEQLVDREALLRGDADPPYWAHLWPGARCLARYLARWVDVRDRRVLDLGCGLGLTGLTAAHAGGRVLFLDAAVPALAFVRASARVGGVACETVCGDFRALAVRERFDVILAAEVAYEQASFEALAGVFARHLRPGGVALLADGYRTDTRPFYRALAARGLACQAVDFRTQDEGRVVDVRLATITPAIERPRAALSRRATPPRRSR